MSIQYVILGFLSRESLTGYDLKKRFAESESFYWSGNNNQIYRALVDLHKEGLVTQDVQHQESAPSRKVYTITDQGRAALREWVVLPPELPQVRNPFLIQLAWADQLDAGELDNLLAQYAEELDVKRRMLEENAHRNGLPPGRTPRDTQLQQAISDRWIAFYTQELAWVRTLRRELSGEQYQPTKPEDT